MNNQEIGTIRLSGDDAVSFANCLFRPTRQEIEHKNRYINRINDNVKIRRNEEGFEAEIADIDLSFLDESPVDLRINIEVTLTVKPSLAFYSTEKCNEIASMIEIEEAHEKYNIPEDNTYLSWAA